MQFTAIALAALATFSGVEAQKVHAVRVAQNGTLTFSPSQLTAAVGDMVQFMFMAGNHTVTQSTFENACQPISAFNRNVTGVHSGFVPYAASAAMGQIPVYTIRVNNTNPIWLYCAQAAHCKNGMSMVINEPNNAQRTLAVYKKEASAITGAAGVPGAATGGSSSTTPNTGTGTGTGTGSGSGTGTGTGSGSGTGTGTTPSGSATTTPITASSNMLSVPSTFGLLGLAAVSYLL